MARGQSNPAPEVVIRELLEPVGGGKRAIDALQGRATPLVAPRVESAV